MFYFLYRLGEFLIRHIPLKAAYRLSVIIADLKYYASMKDKRIIKKNLEVVLGEDNDRIRVCTKAVFRNFCKYLVDFLRQDQADSEWLKKFVKISGTENLNEAFGKGNGVIIFSAHLGNWELGAAVTAMLGYPLNIIALSHKQKKVNEFFDKKRSMKGAKVIPLGGSIKKAFSALDRNEALAILCDRDFSKSDLMAEFFGRETIIPKGIGIFKLRKNAEMVPCLMVREPDDTYTLTYGKAVEYRHTGSEEEDMKGVTRKALEIIETYIRKHPDQWFMFADMWPEKQT